VPSVTMVRPQWGSGDGTVVGAAPCNLPVQLGIERWSYFLNLNKTDRFGQIFYKGVNGQRQNGGKKSGRHVFIRKKVDRLRILLAQNYKLSTAQTTRELH